MVACLDQSLAAVSAQTQSAISFCSSDYRGAMSSIVRRIQQRLENCCLTRARHQRRCAGAVRATCVVREAQPACRGSVQFTVSGQPRAGSRVLLECVQRVDSVGVNGGGSSTR
jgi:hypothetical protein